MPEIIKGSVSVVYRVNSLTFSDGTTQSTSPKVFSVNRNTGDVVLTYADVGADPSGAATSAAATAQSNAESFATSAIGNLVLVTPVYNSGLLTGLSSPTYGGPVLASFTIQATGLYRISAVIYATTNNSSSWVVDVTARYQCTGQAQSDFTVVGQAQIQAVNPGNTSLVTAPSAYVWLSAGTVVNFDTKTDSGTQANGVYNVALLIEQVQNTTTAPTFPQVVNCQTFSNLTTPTSPNVPLASYTIPTTGIYRISADIYPTTLNSGAWVVEVLTGFSQANQAGSNNLNIASCQLQAGNAGVVPTPSVFGSFNAAAVVKFYTVSMSGTQSGGVYSVITLIERLS